MKILATNDDGIYSPGLHALVLALRKAGHEVTAVAPSAEQSSISRALSINRILRARDVCVREMEGVRCVAVEGTPSDCVKLGVLELMDERPVRVVSGVNIGTNTGGDVLYSGTVAAAMEAAYLGLPALAVSTPAVRDGTPDFGALDETLAWAFGFMERHPLPPGVLLNVNFPQGPVAGYRAAPLGDLHYRERYACRTDPRGGRYYWLDGSPAGEPEDARTDVSWLAKGYCTMTPIKLDITDHQFLHKLIE